MVLRLPALDWDSDLVCFLTVTWFSRVVLGKLCDLWFSFYTTRIMYFLCLLQVSCGSLGHLQHACTVLSRIRPLPQMGPQTIAMIPVITNSPGFEL